ncbi:MAG: hypothetical protein ACPGSL_10365 [Vicingaceae bacterium]
MTRTFTKKSLYIPLVGITTYVIVYFVPPFENFIVDLILRSITITLLFVPAVYFLKVSKEFNDLIDKVLKLVRVKG